MDGCACTGVCIYVRISSVFADASVARVSVNVLSLRKCFISVVLTQMALMCPCLRVFSDSYRRTHVCVCECV